MKKRTKWIAGTVAAMALMAGSVAGAADYDKKSIAETAAAAGNFDTLLAAAKAAGLAEPLNSDGPFTVFAPTDEAFAKLPEGTVEALLNDIPKLKTILMYHVVSGTVMAEDVVQLESAETLAGQSVTIDASNGVMVDSASVVKADIECSNGAIHVIDSVILPKDIVGVAASNETFSTLVAAVKAAGLVETLQSDGPFTVFAPTNAAFDALPEGTVESLLKPENKEKLVEVLTYHVVSGRVMASDVIEMDSAETVQGQSVQINVKREDGEVTGVTVNDANVIATDVGALNGVIHVIDNVILPHE